MDIKSLP